MTQFWWVNHNQTARQEIDGQYLWSPKTESNGARSVFYNNMRKAVPGDLVLSYSNQAVRYVGRVTEFAFTAPKPPEFRNTGANWSQEGWLLPVYWTPLEPPVRPKAMIDALGPLGFERLSWERFGVAEAPAVWRTGTFTPHQREYLAHHRTDVFVS
jgi:hypothetical protein